MNRKLRTFLAALAVLTLAATERSAAQTEGQQCEIWCAIGASQSNCAAAGAARPPRPGWPHPPPDQRGRRAPGRAHRPLPPAALDRGGGGLAPGRAVDGVAACAAFITACEASCHLK